MRNLFMHEPVDYLLIGHLTQDLTPAGPVLGGTAAYSALTARALGLRVGIVTAYNPDLALPELEGISIASVYADSTTTFQNIQTPTGRVQHLYHKARSLDLSMVPENWRNAPIVHLGPVAQEVDIRLARAFPHSLVGITPQGWLRGWDSNGRVHPTIWPEARYVLESAGAAVISIEDVQGDENTIEDMIIAIRTLVVTEGSAGARLYWNGDLRYFRPPVVQEIDSTGAGDIFSAAFFIRLQQTRDPWEAARFATQIAANSVTRRGLNSIPTPEEVKTNLVEILP